MKKLILPVAVLIIFMFADSGFGQLRTAVVLGSRGQGVVIKIGQKRGITAGQKFDIYRDTVKDGVRKRIKIGQVLVIKVFPNISVAKIQRVAKNRTIKKGDVAVLKQKSFFTDYFGRGNLRISANVGMANLYLTDFNRAFVSYASHYLIDAKPAKIHSGNLFRGRLKMRLPYSLNIVLDGEYLPVAAAVNQTNKNGLKVNLKRTIESWIGNVGLAYNFWQVPGWEAYAGAKAGFIKSDIKFLNYFSDGHYLNSYFEEMNLSTGVFAGITYTPAKVFFINLETGYNGRGLGHLAGYSYKDGQRIDHVIARDLTGKAITTDLSGFSVTLGTGLRF
ncbi:hypothetical protein BMS3Abin05_02216 [bacterium BMS3Abin05]|nr:hypothetical protein BMS3Abin05_02216 [bacterium BMS3Abin05]GBE28035.1 hypothetical protein BMS3Bbin03_01971 [bacterium BMS3Bbin03]HDZ11343.1 hypothetical protein [Bacteroidota bacterium]